MEDVRVTGRIIEFWRLNPVQKEIWISRAKAMPHLIMDPWFLSRRELRRRLGRGVKVFQVYPNKNRFRVVSTKLDYPIDGE